MHQQPQLHQQLDHRCIINNLSCYNNQRCINNHSCINNCDNNNRPYHRDNNQLSNITTTPEPVVVKQCNEAVSVFDTSSSNEGEQITCRGMTSCPDGSIPPCVWKRKVITKCTADSQNSNGRDLQTGISSRLRLVSNGLPNHCFESGQSTPRENQIDFEIRFKNKQRNNLKRNRVLEGSERVLEDSEEEKTMTLYNGDNQLSVNMALCDEAWTQTGFITSLYPDYIEYSGNFDGIVGISLNGVPIHTGNSEYGSDIFYPKSYGSKLYSTKKVHLDTCLGSSEFSGYYHYYGWSPCILPRGPIKSLEYTSCNYNEACQQDPLAYSLSFMSPQEKTIMIIGVARDGHSILGPYRRDGMLWQPCDVDLCNGLYIGGVYYYVTTMFHPYTVGCWGPSPKKTIAQQCSNNVQVCSGASMVKFFIQMISPIILVYFTILM
ncbi:UNKNOWN [Stylonychia lemnae]|uniref:YHYH domain-containing protein n=1 Tax=Stylonychia lemnae TaxID=5949 RepID=A0A078B9T0_STYLE|nr:UNKNOWN [Stylonychia lemnae]|eukprot:CDW90313.1 UNKNOWN [Stylonychia lemnae]